MNRHERRRAKALGLEAPLQSAAQNPFLKRRELRGFTVASIFRDALEKAHREVLEDDGHRSKPASFYQFVEVVLDLGLRAWLSLEEQRKQKERLIVSPERKMPPSLIAP